MTGFLIFVLVLIPIAMWTSWLIGRATGRTEERNKKPAPVKPVCPCTHTVGEHLEGGNCLAEVKRPYYLAGGGRNGHEWVKCACTKYHGPIVLNEEFFHPGVIAP